MALKIKVCGMREQQNIEAICNLPIDFIGLIFYEKSSRYLEAEGLEGVDLAYIKNEFKPNSILPQKINKVGVFVNAPLEDLVEKVEQYNLDYVQLHGDENIFYCIKLNKAGIKIIKAFPIDETFNFTVLDAYGYYCDYFLFDTKGKLPGGNGVTFDWEILKKYTGSTPFFLSGGLGPGIEDKIREFNHDQLFAIDLNSGFEDRPGFKNIDQLDDFLNKVKYKNRGMTGDW